MQFFHINLILVILTTNSILCSHQDIQQKLVEKLFKNYNKYLRPSETVNVKFAMHLNQIIQLIEKEQNILLNVFIDHEWRDNRFVWNPSEFNNLTVIRVSSDQVWTPDTFVYTTADMSGFLLPQTGAYLVINHEGYVFWPIPSTHMKLRCRMWIQWFPFDEQLCILIFGSWTHTSNYLNYSILAETPSLLNYTENNEWQLISYKPYRTEIKYEMWIENFPFSEIRYKILIRRKSLFVIQNFVTPAVILSILTLVSFFIPFPQEMQIGISILLAFAVFKLRLSDDVPVQSDSVPLINIYFTLCISFSLCSMVWFSAFHFLREKKILPDIIRKLIIYCICPLMRVKLNFRKENSNFENEFKFENKESDHKPVWIMNNSQHELSSILSDRISLNKTVSLDKYNLETGKDNWKRTNSNSFKLKVHARSANNHGDESIASCSSDKRKRGDLCDKSLLYILNRFMFYLFFFSIIFLNIFCLYLLPYHIRKPLSIDDFD